MSKVEMQRSYRNAVFSHSLKVSAIYKVADVSVEIEPVIGTTARIYSLYRMQIMQVAKSLPCHFNPCDCRIITIWEVDIKYQIFRPTFC